MNMLTVALGAALLNVALIIIGISIMGLYTTAIIVGVVYGSSLIGVFLLALWARPWIGEDNDQ